MDNRSLSSRLRYRVTIEGPAAPEDREPTTGEPVESWSAEATVRADVRTASGHELVYAQQVQAEASTVVEIRFRAGVDRTKRLDFRGRKLNIDAAIDPESLGVRLLLFCREET